MKILLINKFYHDNGKSGGVGRHILELEKILTRNDHEVIPFATKQKEAKKNNYLEYFPRYFDLGKVKFNSESLKNISKIFYNSEAAEKLESLIKKTKPDIAHIHNIYHHLSPSILTALKKHNIPIVMTVHDYKLICPNYLLFSKGKICQKCQGGKYYNCLKNKCVKNSYAASLVLMLEAYWAKHKKYYEKNIDCFIAPSLFMRDILIKNGYDSRKIKYVPNFLDFLPTGQAGRLRKNDIKGGNNAGDEKYFLFFGRLSQEKGIDILIKSLPLVNLKKYKLKIAGSGQEENKLKELAKNLKLENKIKFVGYQSGKGLKNLVSEAKFIIIPSVWHENAPYSILESYNAEKAVIGSRIGGIPEMIRENKTGLIFNAGDKKKLAEKINYLITHPKKAIQMGMAGKKYLNKKFNQKKYYNKLVKIYRELREENFS